MPDQKMFNAVYESIEASATLAVLKEKLASINNLDINARMIQFGFPFTPAGLLAKQGRYDRVNWLRECGANVDDIVFGLAMAGKDNEVENYRKKYKASVHHIALGYEVSKNAGKLAEYKEKYNADSKIAQNKYKELSKDIPSKNIAQGKGNGTKELLLGILEKYQTNRNAHGKQYYYYGIFSMSKNSFSLDQKNQAVNELKRALNGENVDLTPHIPVLSNGDLGKSIQKFVASGFANGIAGKEVNTVKDFMQALEEKNTPKPTMN